MARDKTSLRYQAKVFCREVNGIVKVKGFPLETSNFVCIVLSSERSYVFVCFLLHCQYFCNYFLGGNS